MVRLGFADPERAVELVTGTPLGLWDVATNSPVDDDAAMIVSALARAADPDLALSALSGLVDTELGRQVRHDLARNALFRSRLLYTLGASVALGEHLIRRPQAVAGLLEDRFDVAAAEERLAAAVGADVLDPVTGTSGCAAAVGDYDAVNALRDAYRDELVRVAARDLAGELALEQVAEALADLAGYVLRAGLAVARRELPAAAASCRLAVIAMGKTGGRELNYVSDVDVVFVAEPLDADQPVEAALTSATKLAAAMMRICGQAAWEVDANLRPEGASGALVRTLASHEAYYRRWASTWEFQALLKARPIAGDLDLGEAYLAVISPMVWSAAERADFVTDVRAMRRRVVDHIPAAVIDRELKLGPGGLRDVEFALQLLQLVHGRADEALRVRATLPALAALRDGGFVGRDDALSLADAYRFLRTAEHRVQLVRLRRTHLVPDDEAALSRLARAMGFRPDSRGDAAAVWHSEWALHAREVRRLHEKLFYRPLLEAVARVPSEGMRLSPDEARRRLEALGYADPAGALRHLQALTAGLSRRAAIQRTLLPVILSDLASAPDPDAGLLAYRQVSDALGDTPWFLRLLRDEGAVATRLARILGTSRYVAHMLVRAPEALQMLADDAQLVPRRRTEIETTMLTAARRQEDPAAAAHVIRALRRVELLRVAFSQLVGLLDDSAVRIALTELADATLGASLASARAGLAAELDVAELGFDFALIAMGRLGGQELGYGSDADVLFVFRPRGPGSASGGADHAKQAGQLAERLRRMLATPSTDPPLVLDADLRPEGRNGALVRSLDSYAEYYARWSSVWEAQALLRARFCAGDPDLGERFIELIDPLRYPVGGLAPADVIEIRRIKGRVDAERLPRGADPHTHTKLGRGGLSDVEWTAQLLQLRHAAEVAGLRTPSTLPALWAAAEAGLLAAEDAAALEAAWRLASRARDAIMLVRDKAEDQLPTQGLTLVAIGRVLGYPPDPEPGHIVDDYRRATRRARRVVESIFYEPD
ncbi:bifunctional [glutamine synthetase] adenylyltransferase/[glutamine synthetase]-adenylyl-L-tyrosine phosphorylase [Jatrophihabitans telluris]|uniref:Bifunctional glutamine synthetase adenylyltransferase/adenylyl-removing enzyme n=1 Tax=Jatrophihabitans telluris TaxID=2038343 RepID=A0ABY4QUG0_9ACTN|nr:bifunctional [glutamine synthetase] adenylyltransferase/[glutamine synthetase]-adenylyl-L-tyrosine phosphorylase [Jatrophihabitans telluris]UQX87288.1 bifunctional [glutamine synthetase] adenylyltransferase/[glutamine synthetase]-adenylyl-L-tyrosine phosphorylase [Jatrophihabitans telluris]